MFNLLPTWIALSKAPSVNLTSVCSKTWESQKESCGGRGNSSFYSAHGITHGALKQFLSLRIPSFCPESPRRTQALQMLAHLLRVSQRKEFMRPRVQLSILSIILPTTHRLPSQLWSSLFTLTSLQFWLPHQTQMTHAAWKQSPCHIVKAPKICFLDTVCHAWAKIQKRPALDFFYNWSLQWILQTAGERNGALKKGRSEPYGNEKKNFPPMPETPDPCAQSFRLSKPSSRPLAKS